MGCFSAVKSNRNSFLDLKLMTCPETGNYSHKCVRKVFSLLNLDFLVSLPVRND